MRRLFPFVLAIALATITACNRPQPAEDTQPGEEKRAQDDVRVFDHEEPIIVDNGPIKVDFGSSMTPGAAANTWERNFLRFVSLTVYPVDGNGNENPDHPVTGWLLCETCPLYLTYREVGGKGDEVTVELVPDVSRQKVIYNAKTEDHEEPPMEEGQGRLKPRRNMRLVKVNGTTRSKKVNFEESLVDPNNNFKFDHVKVVFTLGR